MSLKDKSTLGVILTATTIAWAMAILLIRSEELAGLLRSWGLSAADKLQEWIAGNIVLQIATVALLLILSAYLVTYVKAAKRSWKRTVWWLCSVLLIMTLPVWKPVSWGIIELHWILCLALFLAVIIEIKKYRAQNKVSSPSSVEGTFPPVTDYTQIEDGWSQYASTLIQMISPATLLQESMAVGISGKWGSGKTTFLNRLRQEMSSTFRTIEFNPWGCESAQRIMTDFFLTLEQSLEVTSSESRAIRRYSHLLAHEGFGLGINTLADMFLMTGTSSTLQERKSRVEEVLNSKGQQPIAIFIDDLDRLEADEVFETLRLIRVTANFRNVVFVAAYDKEYIHQVLQVKGITTGEQFLEKIFNVEISLPRLENSTITRLVYDDVVKMTHLDDAQKKELRETLLLRTKDTSELLLLQHLHVLRQAKRFACLLALNINQMQRQRLEGVNKEDGLHEFVLRDIILLELIHYTDNHLYGQLSRTPYQILEQKTDELRGKVRYFSPKKEFRSNILLSLLFSYQSGKDRRHICFFNSYAKYFCYRVPRHIIPQLDFELLLSSENPDEIRTKVEEWQKDKKLLSLQEHLEAFPMHRVMATARVRNYVRLLTHVQHLLPSDALAGLYYTKLKLNYCNEVNAEPVKEILRAAIINAPGIQWNHNLTAIIADEYTVIDFEEREYELHLLTFEDVKELARLNMGHYIQMNGRPDLLDLTKEHSDFYRFVKAASYLTNVIPEPSPVTPTERDSYSNLLSDELLALYQDTDSPYLQEFKQFYAPRYTDEDTNFARAEACIKRESIFGSLEAYNEFIRQVFIKNEERDNYLNEE